MNETKPDTLSEKIDASTLALFEQELMRAYVWRQTIERPAAARALFIAAHADDVEIGCGGTVLKLLDAGVAALQVVLTDGRLAASDPALRDAMAARRHEEAKSVAAHLMMPAPEWFAVPEGELQQPQREAALIERLAKVLADFKPDTIFLPYFFDQHPDHRYANHLLAGALPRSGLELPRVTVCAFETWSLVPPLWVVDISSVWAEKRRLIQLYRSQLELTPYLDLIDQLNTPRVGLAKGKATAVECFLPFRGDLYVEKAATLDLASPRSLRCNVDVSRPAWPPPV